MSVLESMEGESHTNYRSYLFCFCVVFWTVVAVQRPSRWLHRSHSYRTFTDKITEIRQAILSSWTTWIYIIIYILKITQHAVLTIDCAEGTNLKPETTLDMEHCWLLYPTNRNSAQYPHENGITVFGPRAHKSHGAINHSRVFGGLWLVAAWVYRGKFLKVNGEQPNFQEWLFCLHYHQLCKISLKLISAKFFLPMIFFL